MDPVLQTYTGFPGQTQAGFSSVEAVPRSHVQPSLALWLSYRKCPGQSPQSWGVYENVAFMVKAERLTAVWFPRPVVDRDYH